MPVEIFTVEFGEVILQYPKEISEGDASEIFEWLELVKGHISRQARLRLERLAPREPQEGKTP